MTDAPATPSASPLLFGRYRVLEPAGEWRLATVYVAHDERLQRKVLIHLLRKDLVGQEQFRQRFVAEVAAAARLSHPALLEVFDSGEVAQRPFMVTEYVSGRPLQSLGALSLDQALLYMRQVTGAVALCQNQRSPAAPLGAPHPPISSRNVLLVDEGRIKLVESWMLPVAEAPLDIAHYRAPERAEGRPPTPAAAVYALGVLFYELITGKRPVSGDDPRAVAAAHLTVSIPPVSRVRTSLYLPSLERLLERALNRFPEQRIPDAQAFAEALEAFWRELGSATQRFEVPERPRARRPAPRPTPAGPPTGALDPADQAAAPPLAPPPAPRSLRQRATGFFRADTGTLSGVDREAVRKQNMVQGIVGGLVLVALLLGAGIGSYIGASYLLSRVANIELPSLPLPALPDFGAGGEEPGGQPTETLIVNIEQGLNLRAEPGVNTQIVAILPNRIQVTKLEGPVVVDNVPWARVRVEADGQVLEGWASLNYLIPEP